MLVDRLENNQYIIRIESGESLMVCLEKFAQDTQIGFAWINSIGGGFKKVKYAFSVGYDTGYIIKDAEGPLELLSAEGCIGWDHDDQSKPAVHLHATFIDNELEKAFGGHLMQAEVVGLTAEVKVTVLSSQKKITRKLDKEVNVKLLNLSPYSALEKPGNLSSQSGFPYLVIFILGAIVIGLMTIAAYFISKEKKMEKFKKNK